MLRSGILNPHLASLLTRFRHTNTLVIADRGFPFWPELETVDVSVVDDLPKVTDILRAILPVCVVGHAWMAEEFERHNPAGTGESYRSLLGNVPLRLEPHVEFKKRVPGTIGLIRTGDTVPYANIILESA